MSRKCCDDVWQSMPIFSGAIVKQEQVVHEVQSAGVCRIWSIVRLYRGDPRNKVWWEIPFVESCSLKPFFGTANGKFKAICFGRSIGLFEKYCCLVNGGIQSSAHVVKELSQLMSETVFLRAFGTSAETPECPIAVRLSDKFVRVWLSDPFPFSLKGFEVQACPIKALPAFGEELSVHA